MKGREEGKTRQGKRKTMLGIRKETRKMSKQWKTIEKEWKDECLMNKLMNQQVYDFTIVKLCVVTSALKKSIFRSGAG